jgi:Spy/CpxP family protein refolding chaperone
MNFLKSSLLLLTLGVTSAAFAQAPDQTAPPAPQAAVAPHKQPDPAKEARRLSKQLDLTPEQTSQIAPILADREQRIQTLESSTTLDPKSIHKQRRAIMLDSEQKLNAVLTPAQQQQFATLRADRKHKGEATPPPPPAASL